MINLWYSMRVAVRERSRTCWNLSAILNAVKMNCPRFFPGQPLVLGVRVPWWLSRRWVYAHVFLTLLRLFTRNIYWFCFRAAWSRSSLLWFCKWRKNSILNWILVKSSQTTTIALTPNSFTFTSVRFTLAGSYFPRVYSKIRRRAKNVST